MSGDGAFTPMPLYQCHKRVRALKIADVRVTPHGSHCGVDGLSQSGVFVHPVTTAQIVPADEGYAPFFVSADYLDKHIIGRTREELVGGYYVVYEDGYTSFSPAKAFEEGYTRL